MVKTFAAPGNATEAERSFRLERPTSLVAAGALVAGFLLSSCGGSSSNGIASKSPNQIASTVASLVREAKSVHLKGSYSGSTLDVYLYSNGDVSGSVSKSGLSFNVISIKSSGTYLKAPTSVWQQAANISASQASRFNNKWMKIPGNGFSATSGLTISALASALTDHKGTLSKVGTKTINGQSVVGVHSSIGGTVWVATTGTSYPVELTAPNGSGTVTFSDWDSSSPPSVPKNAISLPSSG